MEVEERQGNSSTDAGDQATSQAGRPPPIIITAATNLLQLQKKQRVFVKGSVEFRNTRNGTRVVTKELSDFSVIKASRQGKSVLLYLLPQKHETYKSHNTAPTFPHPSGGYLRGPRIARLGHNQRQAKDVKLTTTSWSWN
jgi:hypothetical protein